MHTFIGIYFRQILCYSVFYNRKLFFGGESMPNELIKRIRKIYGIVLSCSIVAAGICLIAACYGIYRTGDHPFTREVVAAAFSGIALPVYLCLGLVILGFVLELALPAETPKRTLGKKRQRCKDLLSKSSLSPAGLSLIRGVVLAAGSAFLLWGYFTGGTVDVLTKAINICTECVGLG